MVENLTSLGITPNEIDSDVGDGGEEDEDEELGHWDDCTACLINYFKLDIYAALRK